MALQYRTRGFVFKKEDRSETDRVFSVFTEDFGRVEVVGRSIRKIHSKLRSGTELFSLSEIEFVQGRHRRTLTDAIVNEKFTNLFKCPEKFFAAMELCGALDAFIKGQQPDERIFALLNESLKRINGDHKSSVGLFTARLCFFWKLMALLGYAPELRQCVSCQGALRPYGLSFSNREGGVICSRCAIEDRQAKKINSSVVKVLRLLTQGDWSTLQRLKTDSRTEAMVREISEGYQRHLLYHHVS